MGHVAPTSQPVIDAVSLPSLFQLAPTYLRVEVCPPDGELFDACLDTGSAISLIDKATLELFRPKVVPTDFVIHTASTPTRAQACATFVMHIPCQALAIARVEVECYVLDYLPPRMILGMDFVLRHGILYDSIKGVVTLQLCGLRTRAVGRPSGAPHVVAHVADPPPSGVLAPDMRAPPDMNAYHLPFTIVPDHPHSDALPTFDDDASPALRHRFATLFDEFSEVWRPELGLLRTGEAMRLPSAALDANPRLFKPRLYRVSLRDRQAIDEVFDELARQGRLHPAPPGTPCGWPVFVVYRNGKPRPVVDLQQLNDVVDPDAYPLPTPDELRE